MKILFALILLLINQNLFAQVSNKKLIDKQQAQEIVIDSDKLCINQESFKAVFEGHVVIYFKNYRLFTDKIIVQYDQKNQEVTTIDIPTKLKIIHNITHEVALSDKALYDNVESKLYLKDNVIVEKAGCILKTQNMVYNTKLKKSGTKKNVK